MPQPRTATADGFVRSGIVSHVRDKYGAYEFAKRHPDCVYRDGRRIVFLLDRIEDELYGRAGRARVTEPEASEASR